MRSVAVIDGGHTQFVTNSPNTGLELLAEASMDAITHSNCNREGAFFWKDQIIEN